jgi:hypothetical protein
MALTGLAGSGGFLNPQDTAIYDQNIKNIEAQYNGVVPPGTNLSNQIWAGINTNQYDANTSRSTGTYPVSNAPYVPPPATDIPTVYGQSMTGNQQVTYNPSNPPLINNVPSQYQNIPNFDPIHITPDGSYSEGYFGGGGIGGGGGWFEDKGPYGTGMNMGPIVNGTVQTGGGNFTPDGSYSTGYQGSGEHPEITGESTPGIYASNPQMLGGVLRQGSFGPVIKPDLSNPGKVGDYLDYLKEMGYDTSQYRSWPEQEKIASQYNSQGGNWDTMAFIQKLSQPNSQKTALLQQIAGNQMMPTSQMYSTLGGKGFSNLFAPASYEQYAAMLDKMYSGTPQQKAPQIAQKVNSLNDIPQAIKQQLFTNYVNPYTGTTDEDKLY